MTVIDAQSRPLALVEDANVMDLWVPMHPAERLRRGQVVADVLKGMLRKGKIVINAAGEEEQRSLILRIPQKNKDGEIIGYSEHVYVEGWQTCATLTGAAIIPRWAHLNGNGWDAYSEVQTFDGRVVGGGQSRCDRGEYKWRLKDNYALAGMAQTRSQSRAGRGSFAWIMVLAGFSPTPAEEVPPEGFDDNSETPEPEVPGESGSTPIANDNRNVRIHALLNDIVKINPNTPIGKNKVPVVTIVKDDAERHAFYMELYSVDGLEKFEPEQVNQLEAYLLRRKGAALKNEEKKKKAESQS